MCVGGALQIGWLTNGNGFKCGNRTHRVAKSGNSQPRSNSSIGNSEAVED